MTRRLLMLILLCVTGVDSACAGDMTVGAIDQSLQNVWRANKLEPSPLCSEEQFLRRLSLDLIGRIPTVAELQRFLENPDRAAAIERLLASGDFSRFQAVSWTTRLVGYPEDSTDRETLAVWLEQQLSAGRPYDQIVHELVSSTGESVFSGPVNFLLRYPDEPVVKVSRAFLGIRLDCARCHDHPFDRWTQDDFRRMNRFFEATERQDVSPGNVRLVNVVPDAEPADRPRFLTGAEPRTNQWRSEFGLFLTHSRPFARNFVNRIWYDLLGRGIVHPVDDVSRDNPAVVPEVLDKLAEEAVRSRFDIRHMIRLICSSQAYQFQSIAGLGDAPRQRLFAVRTIKPLTPEQWYDSMAVATDRERNSEERDAFVRTFYGDAIDADFSSTWEYRETVQGLMSRLVESVDPPTDRPEDLFRRILSRPPTAVELAGFAHHTAREVCFILLHSSEFAFNH